MKVFYAPWPERGRRTWGLASILLLFVFYILAAIPMTIGIVVWGLTSLPQDALQDPAAVEAAMTQLPPAGIFFPLLLSQFVLWGLVTLLWVKGFERRGLATIGLGGGIGRLLPGMAMGVGLVILLAIAAIVVSLVVLGGAGMEDASIDGADWSRLAQPDVLVLIGAVSLFFLIQGGMEEVIFRGWLMSALAARWGRVAAVLVSTVVFASLHVQVFQSGLEYGIAAISGIFATGLFFALLAVRQGTIWGAIGAHGAFNATAVLGPLGLSMVQNPEQSPAEVLSEVFAQATGMGGAADFEPQMLGQLVVFGLLSLMLLVGLMRGRGAASAVTE